MTRTLDVWRDGRERCFNVLRCSRHLSTRYNKIAESCLGFIHLASIRLGLGDPVNVIQTTFGSSRTFINGRS